MRFDLQKAGKKGSQWSAEKRSYLWRIILPNGKYRYFPDPAYREKLEDFGHFSDGKFVFKPGLTAIKLVNRLFLGGPVTDDSDEIKTDKETGRPEVKDGMLRHYEVISRKVYDAAKVLRAKQGFVPDDKYKDDDRLPGVHNKFTVNPDGTPKQTLGRTTVKTTVKGPDGKPVVKEWYVYAYAKTPVYKYDGKGRPSRWAGFVGFDNIHPSLNFDPSKLSRDILDSQIGTQDTVEPALVIPAGSLAEKPRSFVPNGETHAERVAAHVVEVKRLHDSAIVPEGHLSLKKPPAPPSAETAARLGITITDKMDLKEIADNILVRVRGRKAKQSNEPKMRKVEIPDWILAKYDNSHETLAAEVRNRPATFLVTTGLFKPTRKSKAFNERLTEEWLPTIYRLSRSDAGALKFTRMYETWRAQDEKRGISTSHPESAVRRHMYQVTSDMAGDLKELFAQITVDYQSSSDPSDRFDKIAYIKLKGAASRIARKWSEQHGQLVPFVEEIEMDEAANKLRQNTPLSPQDAAELQRLTPIARESLAHAIDSMPETYRRVLSSRLYLDDLDLERQEISSRNAKRSVIIQERAEQGKETKRFKHEAEQRKWTGPNGVVSMYDQWLDPKTGNSFNLKELPASSQINHLDRWYTAAIDHLKRRYSMPVAEAEKRLPAAERSHGFVDIQAASSAYGPVDNLTSALLGRPTKTVRRVLTNEGRHVMRYLQLEAKLAETARHARRGEIPQEEDRTTKPVALPPQQAQYKISGKKKIVPIVPSTKPVRQTAIIPAHDIAAHPSGKQRYSANPAVAFFAASKNQALAAQLGLRLHADGSTGTFTLPNVALGSHTQRQVNAAQAHFDRLSKYRKMSEDALAKERATLTGSLKKINTLTNKDGAIDRLHAATIAYAEASQKLRRANALLSERKAALSPALLTKEEIKSKLKAYLPKKADKRALMLAEKKYNKIHQEVAPYAAHIAGIYASVLERPLTSNTAAQLRSEVTAHHSAVSSSIKQRLALLAHEEERRALNAKVQKSFVDAELFVDTLLAYDYALGAMFAVLT